MRILEVGADLAAQLGKCRFVAKGVDTREREGHGVVADDPARSEEAVPILREVKAPVVRLSSARPPWARPPMLTKLPPT